jgi:putative FmdB family regulatory protein
MKLKTLHPSAFILHPWIPMPTYDYKCEACGHRFEKFQSITAKPIRKCPECGKNKVRRLLGTGAGLIFKGSGFYITDYRSESYKSAAKAAEGSSKPAESKSSESKPAESKPSASEKPAAAKPAAKSSASSKK